MTNSKVTIPPSATLFEALKLIDEALKNQKPPVTVDFHGATFALTRDILLVIKKRYKQDQIHLLVSHENEAVIARSLGIPTVVSGVKAEFERQFSKTNLLKHNYTAWEYFLYEVRRLVAYFQFLIEKSRTQDVKAIKIKRTSPNLFLIITALIVSISLLLFIFYFAVGKTMVYIEPQLVVRPISSNIVFQKGTGSVFAGKNTVTLREMNIPVEQISRFTVTTVDPNSISNAYGKVILYNGLSSPQDLRPGTRFVTADGLVFRSDDWIKIPASRTLNGITEIGTAEAMIRADKEDVNAKTIGVRGNIEAGVNLEIPGLKFNRDKIYAKTKDAFMGGVDPKLHLIDKDELEKFKSTMHEQLKQSAIKQIEQALAVSNSSANEDYSLLTADSIVFTGETIVINSNQKIGDYADEIEMRGNVTINALVYDRRATLDYLKSLFRERLLSGTDKEINIAENTLMLKAIISQAEDRSQVKGTMEMNATITYDFENATNTLTRQLKVLIAGLSADEAKARLKQGGQIGEVDIRFSPFWMTRISSNIDNIEFVIRNK